MVPRQAAFQQLAERMEVEFATEEVDVVVVVVVVAVVDFDAAAVDAVVVVVVENYIVDLDYYLDHPYYHYLIHLNYSYHLIVVSCFHYQLVCLKLMCRR